jgi:hypothetical protein
MARVLLLGGSGRVGSAVARSITEGTEHHLWLASRGLQAPLADPLEPSKRLRHVRLDALDEAALEARCREVDLVVSCIGPSGVVGARVARVCRKTGTPYVDAGGYDPLLGELERLDREQPVTAPAIISVGLLPGLSGMFPAHLLAQCARGRRVVELVVAYAGRDAWSYNSAWDIIHGLGDFGAERGFCRLENGALCPVAFSKASRMVEFAVPIGAVRTFLIYSEELRRLALQHGIRDLRVYGANVGARAALVCTLAKLLHAYRSRRGIDRGARWLVRASAHDLTKLDPVYGIQVLARFEDGAAAHGCLLLGDTYAATGAVIGVAAKHLLEHGCGRPGVALLHEAIPPDAFMAAFEAEQPASYRSRLWEEPAPGARPAPIRGSLQSTGVSS